MSLAAAKRKIAAASRALDSAPSLADARHAHAMVAGDRNGTPDLMGALRG